MISDNSSDLLQSLYRISRLAGTARSTREALDVVLDEVLEQTGASRGSIALIDANNGRLQIEVHRGLPEDCPETLLKIGEGITGWVALHGKPIVAADVSIDPRYRQIMSEVRSEMATPIEDDGQLIGVIDVNSDRENAFDSNQLDIINRLAAETALLLRQLWRMNNLQTTAGHLHAVLAVGQGIVSRLDQREILHIITRETVAMSDWRLCAIHLLNDDHTILIPHSSAGGVSGLSHPNLPIGETSAGIAVNLEKQLEIAEVLVTEEEKPLLKFAHSEGLVSLLCTPIVFENQVLGTLSAYTGKLHRFSNHERNLLEAMASLGAVAIHNARLYERVFQSEATLRQREKLTTLGLIAAEIAHEIRNPLTVLKLLFQSLDLKFPEEDARNKDLQIIGEKLDQLEGTVGRVLTFARPAEKPHTLWTLDELILDTLQLVRLKCEQAGIEMTYTANPDTPRVPGDKGQLQQVLLNLLLNSLHAVPSGGRIELLIGSETLGDAAGAFLQITDTGAGIPPELQPDIFQSLLTGTPEGTGLGLGIVKRIVESHRGQIELIRSSADGTVMKVWLPGDQS